jgi:hypothetical protein
MPLVNYGTEYWTQHARQTRKDTDQTNLLIVKLYLSEKDAHLDWIRLFDLNHLWGKSDTTRSLDG